MDVPEVTPEFFGDALGTLGSEPEKFQPMLQGLLMAFPFVLSGQCSCDACETLRGTFTGLIGSLNGRG